MSVREHQLKNMEGQLSGLEAENKIANEQVRDLMRYKAVVEEMRGAKYDVVETKMENKELRDQNQQLKASVVMVEKDKQLLREKIEEEERQVQAKMDEIRKLNAQNHESAMKAFYLQGLLETETEVRRLADEKIADLKTEILKLRHQLKEKEREVEAVKEVVAKQAILGPKESIQLRILEKEKEQMTDKQETLERELANASESAKEQERLVYKLKLRIEELEAFSNPADDRVLAEKDLQIIELIKDCNRKTEEIDRLRGLSASQMASPNPAADAATLQANPTSQAENRYRLASGFQLPEKLTTIEGDYIELRAKISELTYQKIQAETLAAECKANLNRVEERMLSVETENKVLNGDKTDLKMRLNNTENEVKTLKARIDQLGYELKMKEIELRNLTDNYLEAFEHANEGSTAFVAKLRQERAEREKSDSLNGEQREKMNGYQQQINDLKLNIADMDIEARQLKEDLSKIKRMNEILK